jgi:hypothetical protein
MAARTDEWLVTAKMEYQTAACKSDFTTRANELIYLYFVQQEINRHKEAVKWIL